jgi:UDP-N-acetylmuramate--alanine ligase
MNSGINMNSIHRIHFVGIGGIGMSGIALILSGMGYVVTGSDLKESDVTNRLREKNIIVDIGHGKRDLKNLDLLVISTAIPSFNVDVINANKLGVKIISRGEMLAKIMGDFYNRIAISGSHGKTTVTSMLAYIFVQSCQDPSYIIGGKMNGVEHTAKLGGNEYMIAEADESDASFLKLLPTVALILNIDKDHMHTYDYSVDNLKSAFVNFANLPSDDGFSVVCLDDINIASIYYEIEKNVYTYGFLKGVDYQILNYTSSARSSRFDIHIFKDGMLLECCTCSLPVIGRHNAQNAVASFVVAYNLGIPTDNILSALGSLPGAYRRLNIYEKQLVNDANVCVIDDYGHHPKEIEMTVKTIKEVYPNRRIIHSFQPHRFSRTQELFADMVKALSLADIRIILDTYSAGGERIEGATSSDLKSHLELVGKETYRVQGVLGLQLKIKELINDNDIILMQGAGDISEAKNLLIP